MAYGIVGVGSLATAIVQGLCGGGDEAPTIMLSPRNAEAAGRLAARFPTVRIAATNQAVLDESAIVILSLRPQEAETALADLAFSANHSVISVMAGISVETLGRMVGPAREVARAIPLISVSSGNGVTPVHPPSPTARLLFDRLGGAVEIADELAFEAFAATMATIAAQYGHLGAISRWLTAKGVPERDARRHVAATFCGVAAGLQSDDPDFVRLAREHATPGGVNEQFLADLDAAGTFETVRLALDRVFARLTQPCMVDASAQR